MPANLEINPVPKGIPISDDEAQAAATLHIFQYLSTTQKCAVYWNILQSNSQLRSQDRLTFLTRDSVDDPFIRDASVEVMQTNSPEPNWETLNQAAADSDCEWLLFLGEQDLLAPNGIMAWRSKARAANAIVQVIAPAVIKHRDGAFGPKWIYAPASLQQPENANPLILGCATIRRSSFVEHGGFDESREEGDWVLWKGALNKNGVRAFETPNFVMTYVGVPHEG